MPDKSVNDVTEEVPSTEVMERCVEQDLDGLVDLLFNGGSRNVREDAALAIGILMGDDAIEPFIGLFAHEDPEIRMVASWGLNAIGAPAVGGLVAALSNEDAIIRKWAVYTLGFIGGCRAERALAQMVDDEDPDVRWWAAWALDHILEMHGTCCSGC
ncbi:PBS lyase HEAT domain protein repeat-containing protein [Methanofollis liminatans DSM 4140]|uniref:PBS lyase HEAT domain protein repeat-containing protein n=1 Tax=Methanofollis liminatans DSM 4140 TaxID=28892 RepID=J1L2J0_9EURY|nr:PBS lyase HEAT domain protein repeat-containing protein [Methanofollis liminatans DSM 4140]